MFNLNFKIQHAFEDLKLVFAILKNTCCEGLRFSSSVLSERDWYELEKQFLGIYFDNNLLDILQTAYKRSSLFIEMTPFITEVFSTHLSVFS